MEIPKQKKLNCFFFFSYILSIVIHISVDLRNVYPSYTGVPWVEFSDETGKNNLVINGIDTICHLICFMH